MYSFIYSIMLFIYIVIYIFYYIIITFPLYTDGVQIQKAISESYADYMAGRAYVYNVARHLDLSVSTISVSLYW